MLLEAGTERENGNLVGLDRIHRVLVCGAGVAGLQTARALLRSGFSVVVLEEENQVGGVWTRNHAGYALQVPWHVYQFPDYPYPPELRPTSEHPSGPEVLAYVESYARKFNLHRHIRFNSQLKYLRQVPPAAAGDAPTWVAQYADRATGQEFEVTANFVVLATGLFSSPFIPSFEGLDKFEGVALHSKHAASVDLARGTNVVVVGAGRTGWDLVSEIGASQVAKSVTILYRHPHWTLPREFGRNEDVLSFLYSRRTLAMLPPYYKEGRVGRARHALLRPLKSVFWGRVTKVTREKSTVAKMPLPDVPLESDLFNGGQIYDPAWCNFMQDPRVHVQQGTVRAVEPRGVQLEDGTKLPCDVLLFCTGYYNTYKFLSHEVRQALEIQQDGLYLYRNVLPPHVANLAFVGAEVSTFNNLLTSGLQAEWLSRALTGHVALPSRRDMEADVGELRVWRRQAMPPARNRASVYMLYQQAYHDQLMADMREAVHRKSWRSPLSECFAPYLPEDYAEVVAPSMFSSFTAMGQSCRRSAARRVTSAHGRTETSSHTTHSSSGVSVAPLPEAISRSVVAAGSIQAQATHSSSAPTSAQLDSTVAELLESELHSGAAKAAALPTHVPAAGAAAGRCQQFAMPTTLPVLDTHMPAKPTLIISPNLKLSSALAATASSAGCGSPRSLAAKDITLSDLRELVPPVRRMGDKEARHALGMDILCSQMTLSMTSVATGCTTSSFTLEGPTDFLPPATSCSLTSKYGGPPTGSTDIAGVIGGFNGQKLGSGGGVSCGAAMAQACGRPLVCSGPRAVAEGNEIEGEDLAAMGRRQPAPAQPQPQQMGGWRATVMRQGASAAAAAAAATGRGGVHPRLQQRMQSPGPNIPSASRQQLMDMEGVQDDGPLMYTEHVGSMNRHMIDANSPNLSSGASTPASANSTTTPVPRRSADWPQSAHARQASPGSGGALRPGAGQQRRSADSQRPPHQYGRRSMQPGMGEIEEGVPVFMPPALPGQIRQGSGGGGLVVDGRSSSGDLHSSLDAREIEQAQMQGGGLRVLMHEVGGGTGGDRDDSAVAHTFGSAQIVTIGSHLMGHFTHGSMDDNHIHSISPSEPDRPQSLASSAARLPVAGAAGAHPSAASASARPEDLGSAEHGGLHPRHVLTHPLSADATPLHQPPRQQPIQHMSFLRSAHGPGGQNRMGGAIVDLLPGKELYSSTMSHLMNSVLEDVAEEGTNTSSSAHAFSGPHTANRNEPPTLRDIREAGTALPPVAEHEAPKLRYSSGSNASQTIQGGRVPAVGEAHNANLEAPTGIDGGIEALAAAMASEVLHSGSLFTFNTSMSGTPGRMRSPAQMGAAPDTTRRTSAPQRGGLGPLASDMSRSPSHPPMHHALGVHWADGGSSGGATHDSTASDLLRRLSGRLAGSAVPSRAGSVVHAHGHSGAHAQHMRTYSSASGANVAGGEGVDTEALASNLGHGGGSSSTGPRPGSSHTHTPHQRAYDPLIAALLSASSTLGGGDSSNDGVYSSTDGNPSISHQQQQPEESSRLLSRLSGRVAPSVPQSGSHAVGRASSAVSNGTPDLAPCSGPNVCSNEPLDQQQQAAGGASGGSSQGLLPVQDEAAVVMYLQLLNDLGVLPDRLMALLAATPPATGSRSVPASSHDAASGGPSPMAFNATGVDGGSAGGAAGQGQGMQSQLLRLSGRVMPSGSFTSATSALLEADGVAAAMGTEGAGGIHHHSRLSNEGVQDLHQLGGGSVGSGTRGRTRSNLAGTSRGRGRGGMRSASPAPRSRSPPNQVLGGGSGVGLEGMPEGERVSPLMRMDLVQAVQDDLARLPERVMGHLRQARLLGAMGSDTPDGARSQLNSAMLPSHLASGVATPYHLLGSQYELMRMDQHVLASNMGSPFASTSLFPGGGAQPQSDTLFSGPQGEPAPPELFSGAQAVTSGSNLDPTLALLMAVQEDLAALPGRLAAALGATHPAAIEALHRVWSNASNAVNPGGGLAQGAELETGGFEYLEAAEQGPARASTASPAPFGANNLRRLEGRVAPTPGTHTPQSRTGDATAALAARSGTPDMLPRARGTSAAGARTPTSSTAPSGVPLPTASTQPSPNASEGSPAGKSASTGAAGEMSDTAALIAAVQEDILHLPERLAVIHGGFRNALPSTRRASAVALADMSGGGNEHGGPGATTPRPSDKQLLKLEGRVMPSFTAPARPSDVGVVPVRIARARRGSSDAVALQSVGLSTSGNAPSGTMVLAPASSVASPASTGLTGFTGLTGNTTGGTTAGNTSTASCDTSGTAPTMPAPGNIEALMALVQQDLAKLPDRLAGRGISGASHLFASASVPGTPLLSPRHSAQFAVHTTPAGHRGAAHHAALRRLQARVVPSGSTTPAYGARAASRGPTSGNGGTSEAVDPRVVHHQLLQLLLRVQQDGAKLVERLEAAAAAGRAGGPQQNTLLTSMDSQSLRRLPGRVQPSGELHAIQPQVPSATAAASVGAMDQQALVQLLLHDLAHLPERLGAGGGHLSGSLLQLGHGRGSVGMGLSMRKSSPESGGLYRIATEEGQYNAASHLDSRLLDSQRLFTRMDAQNIASTHYNVQPSAAGDLRLLDSQRLFSRMDAQSFASTQYNIQPEGTADSRLLDSQRLFTRMDAQTFVSTQYNIQPAGTADLRMLDSQHLFARMDAQSFNSNVQLVNMQDGSQRLFTRVDAHSTNSSMQMGHWQPEMDGQMLDSQRLFTRMNAQSFGSTPRNVQHTADQERGLGDKLKAAMQQVTTHGWAGFEVTHGGASTSSSVRPKRNARKTGETGEGKQDVSTFRHSFTASRPMSMLGRNMVMGDVASNTGARPLAPSSNPPPTAGPHDWRVDQASLQGAAVGTRSGLKASSGAPHRTLLTAPAPTVWPPAPKSCEVRSGHKEAALFQLSGRTRRMSGPSQLTGFNTGSASGLPLDAQPAPGAMHTTALLDTINSIEDPSNNVLQRLSGRVLPSGQNIILPPPMPAAHRADLEAAAAEQLAIAAAATARANELQQLLLRERERDRGGEQAVAAWVLARAAAARAGPSHSRQPSDTASLQRQPSGLSNAEVHTYMPVWGWGNSGEGGQELLRIGGGASRTSFLSSEFNVADVLADINSDRASRMGTEAMGGGGSQHGGQYAMQPHSGAATLAPGQVPVVPRGMVLLQPLRSTASGVPSDVVALNPSPPTSSLSGLMAIGGDTSTTGRGSITTPIATGGAAAAAAVAAVPGDGRMSEPGVDANDDSSQAFFSAGENSNMSNTTGAPNTSQPNSGQLMGFLTPRARSHLGLMQSSSSCSGSSPLASVAGALPPPALGATEHTGSARHSSATVSVAAAPHSPSTSASRAVLSPAVLAAARCAPSSSSPPLMFQDVAGSGTIEQVAAAAHDASTAMGSAQLSRLSGRVMPSNLSLAQEPAYGHRAVAGEAGAHVELSSALVNVAVNASLFLSSTPTDTTSLSHTPSGLSSGAPPSEPQQLLLALDIGTQDKIDDQSLLPTPRADSPAPLTPPPAAAAVAGVSSGRPSATSASVMLNSARHDSSTSSMPAVLIAAFGSAFEPSDPSQSLRLRMPARAAGAQTSTIEELGFESEDGADTPPPHYSGSGPWTLRRLSGRLIEGVPGNLTVHPHPFGELSTTGSSSLNRLASVMDPATLADGIANGPDGMSALQFLPHMDHLAGGTFPAGQPLEVLVEVDSSGSGPATGPSTGSNPSGATTRTASSAAQHGSVMAEAGSDRGLAFVTTQQLSDEQSPDTAVMAPAAAVVTDDGAIPAACAALLALEAASGSGGATSAATASTRHVGTTQLLQLLAQAAGTPEVLYPHLAALTQSAPHPASARGGAEAHVPGRAATATHSPAPRTSLDGMHLLPRGLTALLAMCDGLEGGAGPLCARTSVDGGAQPPTAAGSVSAVHQNTSGVTSSVSGNPSQSHKHGSKLHEHASHALLSEDTYGSWRSSEANVTNA